MNTPRVIKALGIMTAVLLGFAVCSPSWAAFGSSPGQAIKGTVQNIDYLHHAITVNGQTYVVAPHARFSGVAGFSILHIGMPIAYVLGSSSETRGPQAPPAGLAPDDPGMTQPDSGPPVITSITWLPGGV